ncbi:hypothetical protein T12_15851 [Trichinella patagoniensis]|uniref:Uncharacterized protein n=1 Tax=Trichinella patagoniensis TaxID=990121 RepID=A0A0V1AGM6_9BILA|nr:hypothetical protein T12_15851 [Trichinella patagoniensis]
MRFGAVCCSAWVWLHYINGPLNIQIETSENSILLRHSASSPHALSYTVCSDDSKAARSGGDQTSIQKGVAFAAGKKTQNSALVAASVKLHVAMIAFTFFVKIALINLACPNKRASKQQIDSANFVDSFSK